MFITKALRRSLYQPIRYFCFYSFHDRVFDYRLKKHEKKIGFTRPVRPMGDFSDTLEMPNITQPEIVGLWSSLKKQTEIVLSSENIGFVLYQFDKKGLLSNQIFEILYPQLRRYSGEYQTRTIFAGLYTSLKHNNQQFFDFFTNEFKVGQMSLRGDQTIELIEALSKTQLLQHSEKHQYFINHFEEDFIDFMENVYKETDIKRTCNIIKVLDRFQYYEQRVWNHLLSRFWKQKGSKRLMAYQHTIKYVDKIPMAQQLADYLKEQLLKSQDATWRYNFQQGRYYTNFQMAEKSQDNIKLVPAEVNMFKPRYRKQISQRFLRLLSQGSLKQQKQIEQDKARALGYAIMNRYESDQVSGKQSMFEQQEYEKMFGMDAEEMDKFISEVQKIQPTIVQEKKPQQQLPKKVEKTKQKKGKGKK